MSAAESSSDARLIGRVVGSEPGPTLVLVAAVHGNEPAGVSAVRAVLERLERDGVRVRGELVALVGNVRALAAGRRYLARDLNRQWTAERVDEARAAGAGAEAELCETVELADALDRAIARARGEVFVLDLHTTSAEGTPFAVVGDTEAHRQFAAAFELPGIRGLEGELSGVLTGYLGARGCVTLAVEGGQHRSPAAEENLAAAVTVALAASGVVASPDVPGLAAAHARLALARGDLPRVIQVISRHAVGPDDAFRMEPGFATIHRVRAGTLLARDRTGEIRAPSDALLLLPLYQSQGSDGFFLAH